jgi:hypothetical protein
MKHIDEHTLGLYILRAGSVENQRSTIEAHLTNCMGCRSKAEELALIYTDVERDLANYESLSDVSPASIIRANTTPLAHARDLSPVPSEKSSRILARRAFTQLRRHPVVVSGFLIGLSAILFFSLDIPRNVFSSHESERPVPHKVRQPAKVELNSVKTALDVLDPQGDVIFSIDVSEGEEVASGEAIYRLNRTQIGNLGADGSLEIITGTPAMVGGIVKRNLLRAFDQRGEPVFERQLAGPVQFRGEEYTPSYAICGLQIASVNGPSANSEIWVGLLHYRSPSVIARLDEAGNPLGEYWHFGHISAPQIVHLEGEDHPLIAFYGVNDVRDVADSSFPVFGILDPRKILGKSQFSESAGFGLPKSDAEMYYVRFADSISATPHDSTKGIKGACTFIRMTEDSSIVVHYDFSGAAAAVPRVDYTFDRTMKLRMVSFDDGARQMLQERTLKSKSPTKLERFRAYLKEAVRYWDGQRWRHEVTKVDPRR